MLRLILSPVLLALVGCAWLWGPWPVYPVTSGFHSSSKACGTPGRYAVWSKQPGVDNYIAGLLLQMGQPVVERARLEQIFHEQKLRLIHSSDADADVLHVGRLAGASQVIFAEVSPQSAAYVREAY